MIRAARIALLLALVPAAQADTILKIDGKTLSGVEITSEGVAQVEYKNGGKVEKIASGEVLSVTYGDRPQAIDEVDSLVLVEDLDGALGLADDLANRLIEKPDRKYKWAGARAAWMAVEIAVRMGDDGSVRQAATRVIEKHADTRYAALAYLAKARAELRGGSSTAAAKTIAALKERVASESLGKRFELEARLVATQADDSLPPSSKRNEFERIAGEAGGIALVRGRAEAAIGESLLAEAAANPGKAASLRKEAQGVFEKVVGEEFGDPMALAQAHAGLGEALFLLGADSDDADVLREAVLNLLRVPTLYRSEGDLVARSLFYAMRCFDLMRVPDRKLDMGRELVQRYAATSWAEEAKKF
jgi:hypothetical protein